MPTKDPKDVQPIAPENRPDPDRPPYSPVGAEAIKPEEPAKTEYSRPSSPELSQRAGATPGGGAASAQDVREGARQMVDQLSHSGEEARQSMQDFAQRADLWLRHQTDDRPWAIVLGALTAGYVVGGGIPRVAVRFLARVGLPVVAAFGVARAISWEDDQLRQQDPHPRTAT